MSDEIKNISRKEMIYPGDNTDNVIEPSHYVGIGASAGGLEALEKFFTHMPAQSDLAFIVIQHLSPDYKSLMVEIISKRTPMKVYRAEDGIVVSAGCIYLIPPKKNLTIFHGRIMLSEQDHSRGLNLPIDIFFRSLAEDQGEKAVGIILSGTGSDGMRGVRAIKENGGTVMVQSEESAKFNGMPRAAVSTGLSDFVLSPEEMPEQLLLFIKHPCMVDIKRGDKLISEDNGITKIFALVRDKCKIDFTYYKPTTIMRRIERRMIFNQMESLNDYVNYLSTHPVEIDTLYRELLIGVTSFFRDPHIFEAVSNDWLPGLIRDSRDRELRVWVAGGSTGEEAYSIAILIRECMEKLGIIRDVKIFATDVDRSAIQFAQAGSYHESIAADIHPKYLSKYFFKKEDTFQIIRSIREMVVFAQHNLIKDPPFTKIDIISCRNLLIYFQPILQKRVLEAFSFSLNQNGIMLLGSSETTGDMSEFFKPLDSRFRIYQCIRPFDRFSSVLARDGQMDGGFRARSRHGYMSTPRTHSVSRNIDTGRLIDGFMELLSKEYVPLSLIVNEYMEVVHVLGNTEGFFRIPQGAVLNDISKMAIDELSVPITTGIQKVFRTGTELRYTNISVVNGYGRGLSNETTTSSRDLSHEITKKSSKAIANISDDTVDAGDDGSKRSERENFNGILKRMVKVLIKPLFNRNNTDKYVVIFVEDMEKEEISQKQEEIFFCDINEQAAQHINDLKQELAFTRESLQATVEELETSNEELQASNEELLASNEELQSTNEELQSTNEELHTVNIEFQNKIIELSELNNDVENLLASSHIGKLILDDNLEIRKFSSHVTRIFKILDSDIGRPISHLSHNLKDDDLIELVEQVIMNNQEIEKEVETKDGDYYMMKILPYQTGPQHYAGVILNFININPVKRILSELESTESRYRNLFVTMNQGVIYQDSEGRIISANPSAERIMGCTLEQMAGRKVDDPAWQIFREDGSVFPVDEYPANRASATGEVSRNVVMGIRNSMTPEIRWFNVSAVPLFNEGEERAYQVYSTFDDISGIVEIRQNLNQLVGQLVEIKRSEIYFDPKENMQLEE